MIRILAGIRPRGRPRQWWLDKVVRDIRVTDESKKLEDLEDRKGQRKLVETAKSLNAFKVKK